MRKYLLSFMLIAGAISLTSCTDDDTFAQKGSEGSVMIIAGNPEIKADTRTELSTTDDGKFVPMWSVKDKIHVFIRKPNFANCTVFESNNEAPADKVIFTNTGEIETFNSKAMVAVHGFGDKAFTSDEATGVFKEECKLSGLNIPMLQTIATPGSFDKNADILISKPIPADWDTTTPLELQFKRLNGFIRLNIVDETSSKLLSGVEVNLASFSTEYDSYLASKFDYNYKEDSIYVNRMNKNDGVTAVSNFQGGLNYIATIGDEKEGSIYLSCLPKIIPADKVVTVEFNTNNLIKGVRKIKLNRDFIVQSGKITTVNVKFTDKDISYLKTFADGNNVYSNAAGSLTEDIVRPALENDSASLRVNGPIDAHDFDILYRVASQGTFSHKILDLRSATLPDNALPERAIKELFGYYTVVLPSTMTTMKAGSVCNGQTDGIGLVIPASLENIEDGAITGRLRALYFLGTPSASFSSAAFAEKEGFAKTSLSLNKEWAEAMNDAPVISENKWMGFTFKDMRLITVNADGTVSGLPSIHGTSIETTAAGQILYSDILTAYRSIDNYKRDFNISGPINLKDFNKILEFFADGITEVDLNLRSAVMKDNNGKDLTVLKARTFPSNVNNNSLRFRTIALPSSLTTIEKGAIQPSFFTSNFVFGPNITSLAEGAIQYSSAKDLHNNEHSIEIDIPYSTSELIHSPLTQYTERFDLILDSSWEGNVSGNTWKGFTWNSISFKQF